MHADIEQTIFKKGSTTYYFGARFFPRDVRADVLKLYSFLRVADDYVDVQPLQKAKFRALRRAWEHAAPDPQFDPTRAAGDTIDERVIKNMVFVFRKHAFDPAWVTSFLDAMQADVEGKTYSTFDDTLWYMYGSAEVVGLMMAKIMNLSPDAYETAKMQGRAMQYINFIRDIAEDNALGRRYIPRTELQVYGLPDLYESTAHAHPAAFKKCMRAQIQYYRDWQKFADEGLVFMSGLLRPGLRTAISMYNWTAAQIAKDPFVVFERKVKPSKRRLLRAGLASLLFRGHV